MFELFARKLSKVSGYLLKDSRFSESRVRDGRKSHYMVGMALELAAPSLSLARHSSPTPRSYLRTPCYQLCLLRSDG